MQVSSLPICYVIPDRKLLCRFTIELVEQGYADKLRTFCDKLPELAQSNSNVWTVVGEFTTASTDCETRRFIQACGVVSLTKSERYHRRSVLEWPRKRGSMGLDD